MAPFALACRECTPPVVAKIDLTGFSRALAGGTVFEVLSLAWQKALAGFGERFQRFEALAYAEPEGPSELLATGALPASRCP